MIRMISAVLLILSVFSSAVFAMPIVDRAAIDKIGTEIEIAVTNKDEAALLQYIHSESKITIQGRDISYAEYETILGVKMSSKGSSGVKTEVVSFTRDKENNSAIVETKTTAILEMMGMKIKDVSLNKTKYGVIDGEIKVLESEDTSISSGRLNN